MFNLENFWQLGLAAAIFALILIAGIWALRRAGSAVRGKRGSRLAVAETRAVDKSRHLVLVQCDNEEHLLLIGGPQDVVVKTNVGEDFFEADTYPRASAPIPAPVRAPETDPARPRQAAGTNFTSRAGAEQQQSFGRKDFASPREPVLANPTMPRPSPDRG
jgi:flagellar biogenesis protein FliO